MRNRSVYYRNPHHALLRVFGSLRNRVGNLVRFAEAVTNKGKIKYGSSKDALETMKLVYRIYWADPEWREKYDIENPD